MPSTGPSQAGVANGVELRFPPVRTVTITVTNGPASVMFASVRTASNWQSATYDAQQRPLLPGVWVFGVDDFNGSMPCAVNVKSTTSTQLATVSISA